MDHNHAQQRDDSGQSTRYIFGLKGGMLPTNKRSQPDSPANSLSGSISEPLHLEPIAPSDRLGQDILLRRVDVTRPGHAATSRPSYFATHLPKTYASNSSTMSQEPMVQAATTTTTTTRQPCKRCLRGPSYHHGHSPDCPKSHYAKRLRTELAMAASASPVCCRRCIIGPSHHKAHAPNCPRSKYYQKVLKGRDRRDHR